MSMNFALHSLSFACCIVQAPISHHRSPPARTHSIPSLCSVVTCCVTVDTSDIIRKLKKRCIDPTPKVVHQLRKKEIQKAKRRIKKEKEKVTGVTKVYTLSDVGSLEERWRLMDEDKKEEVADEFLCVIHDSKQLAKVQKGELSQLKKESFLNKATLVGRNVSSRKEETGRGLRTQAIKREEIGTRCSGGSEKMATLGRLGNMQSSTSDNLACEETNEKNGNRGEAGLGGVKVIREARRVLSLANRLNKSDYWTPKWQFSKLMHSGRLKLTDDRVLRLVQLLGDMGNWRCAMQVVSWFHNRQRCRNYKSRYVYTTMLSVLGKAHRPVEALRVFNEMRKSLFSYPDMASYHSVAVTLGQAGHLKELLELIKILLLEVDTSMKESPMLEKAACLSPDIVVYNAVINACVPHKEWRCALWTWEHLRKTGILPNSATFGLMIEVMVRAGKFDLALQYFTWMGRAGLSPNALTYQSVVNACGRKGCVDDAIKIVEQMEHSGIVESASVYFALACSLCMAGRWQDALLQVTKMQRLTSRKSNVITYTGLIQACKRAGRVYHAILLFEHMQQVCAPNVGTCNAMINLYGRNHMFKDARALFEEMKKGWIGNCRAFKSKNRLSPDIFTYEAMLGACAISEEWDYFDLVYRQMTMRGHQLCGDRNMWLMNKIVKSGKRHLVDSVLCHSEKAAGFLSQE